MITLKSRDLPGAATCGVERGGAARNPGSHPTSPSPRRDKWQAAPRKTGLWARHRQGCMGGYLKSCWAITEGVAICRDPVTQKPVSVPECHVESPVILTSIRKNSLSASSLGMSSPHWRSSSVALWWLSLICFSNNGSDFCTK